ncbi:MAG: thermonuclease family protein [Bauldia sp.]|nr:thermonuclease family protein [Bauldia sp.]
MRRVLQSALFLLTATHASAQSVTGAATALDADTVNIGGTRVLLYGIESVEAGQPCVIDGQVWDCYPAALRALETLVSLSEVTCDFVGEPDRFRRVLGVCHVAGKSINLELVATGWAVAKRNETEEYVPAEEAARAEGLGLWQSSFLNPTEFRESQGIFIDRQIVRPRPTPQ